MSRQSFKLSLWPSTTTRRITNSEIVVTDGVTTIAYQGVDPAEERSVGPPFEFLSRRLNYFSTDIAFSFYISRTSNQISDLEFAFYPDAGVGVDHKYHPRGVRIDGLSEKEKRDIREQICAATAMLWPKMSTAKCPLRLVFRPNHIRGSRRLFSLADQEEIHPVTIASS